MTLKRLLVVAFALIVASTAHAQSVLQLRAGAYDSDAQAYFNALAGNGCATPTAAFQLAVSNYIVAEKAAGNWGGQDAEYILATADSCTASINLAQPSLYTVTYTGACVWNATTGLSGNQTDCYGDTNVNQSALKRMQQNNAHSGVFLLTANRGNVVGLLNNGNGLSLNNLTNKTTKITSATAVTDTAGGVIGYNSGVRTSSSAISTYGNGSVQSNAVANTSAALVAAHVLICRVNASFCGANTKIVFVDFGAAIQDETFHYANIRSLLIALGVTGI